MEALAGAEAALILVLAAGLVAVVALAGWLFRALGRERSERQEADQRLVRYQSLDDALVEEQRATRAATELRAEVSLLEAQASELRTTTARDRAALEKAMAERRAELDREVAAKQAQLRQVEEAATLQEFAVYHTHYSYDTAGEYADELNRVRADLKASIQGGTACVCTADWVVEGSRKKGEQMTKKQIKLMLRAFNGESDAAIAKVKYSNAEAMEKRVERAFAAINKMGAPNKTSLQHDYLDLKLAELRLVHEHAVKKQEEKEAAREAAAQLREEEKAAKELAKVTKAAEKEERDKQRALAKARAELDALHAENVAVQQEQTSRLEAAVAKLESELQDALDRKAKAIARAQLTRSGWVYVLSNIGSFGEGVFKIGLTRRFDPTVRVKELGDASVPFLFDVHAMVFSEDAPTLENALHKRFDDRRVNMVNRRKEYFRVSLAEIREAFAELHGMVSFVLEPEAPEYWETRAVLREAATNAHEDEVPLLPL